MRPLGSTCHWAATTRWAAAMLLIGSTAGCGEAVQENQELQMDRRQVDTYGDEPAADADADPSDEPLLAPVEGD